MQSDDLIEGVDRVLFSRFEVVDGKLTGDNRSDLMGNAYELIGNGSFLWGIDSRCILDVRSCNNNYPPFGENILSLLALVGILMSIPYYVCLVVFVIYGVD